MIKKLERMGAAIAFAEAGQFDTAREILAEVEKKHSGGRRKIVLVANDAPIKTGLVEYALSLASRIQSDTIFLNIFSGKQTSAGMNKCSTAFNKLWKKCSENDALEGRHGYFALRGDAPRLITDVCHRLGHVEMVIIQKQRNVSCDYKLPVPVFCFE
ncbi:MAG: hypothetical protein KKB70_03170 [Proteobacteria bacterium]|nr:hypothetical protein [Pseudomonadota bacterium]MBU1611467.1 hypothetical protein [Pseudomonadota bacterium]